MKYSTLIADMIAENATTDMILVAVRAVERQEEDALERRRAADRARQERHRSASVSRDKTLRNVSHAPSRSRAHVEDKTSSTVQEPQEQKASRTQGDLAAFRAGLAPDVPVEVVEEFIKVRRRKRGALTGFAAGLFREDAAKCGMSVVAAATECVRSSWITVKPEYFAGRPRAGPTAAKPNPGLATIDALLEQVDAVTSGETQGNPPYPYLVAFSGGG